MIGDTALAELDYDFIQHYITVLYEESGSAATADLHTMAFRLLWRTVRSDPAFGLRGRANPAAEIKRFYKPSSGRMHKRWPESAQQRFTEAAPEHLKLAMSLLHLSGQRGGDAVRMKWTDYDGKGIFVQQEKGTAKGEDPEPVYHLLPAVLRRRLDAARKTATSKFILVSSTGKPWSSSRVLSAAIRRHLIKIGLAAKNKRTISMHGLRHSTASEAAMLGIGIGGIMTITGHKSEKMAKHYTAQAERLALHQQAFDVWDAHLEAREAEREAAAKAVAAPKAKRRGSLKAA